MAPRININIFYFLSVLMIIFTSCKKEEGVGGRASISGKIIYQEKNSVCILGPQYEAVEERVYIIYGGTDSLYNDEIRTNFDGTFKFDYLRKGIYTLFVYSECECDGCVEGKKPLFTTVEVSDKKQEVELTPITIIKEKK